MTPETLIDILRNALQVGCLIAAPAIVFGLIAGVGGEYFSGDYPD